MRATGQEVDSSRTCSQIWCAHTGVKAKLSPLCKRPKKVFLSTGNPLTHEYTCLKKGILNMADDIRQLKLLPSPIFPGNLRKMGLKANTAYGSCQEK